MNSVNEESRGRYASALGGFLPAAPATMHNNYTTTLPTTGVCLDGGVLGCFQTLVSCMHIMLLIYVAVIPGSRS